MTRTLVLVKGQLRRAQPKDGCVACGLLIRSALVWAKVHPEQGEADQRVLRLCCTCHRLYEHRVVTTAELLDREDRWALGARPEQSPWFRCLAADLASGRRGPRRDSAEEAPALHAERALLRRKPARALIDAAAGN